MAGFRHVPLAFLAVVGLFSIRLSSESAACPLQPQDSMHAMHHVDGGHPMPMSQPLNHDPQICAACLAVLPPLPPTETHILPPVALFSGKGRHLSGIDPSLDPPPPRAA